MRSREKHHHDGLMAEGLNRGSEVLGVFVSAGISGSLLVSLDEIDRNY